MLIEFTLGSKPGLQNDVEDATSGVNPQSHKILHVLYIKITI